MRHGKSQAPPRLLAAQLEIRRAVAGRGSKRVLADAPLRERETFGIVANFRGESLRPQRDRARHGLLHMGVAGQRHGAVARGQRFERIRHRRRAAPQFLGGIAQVQAQGGEHLIVARAAGMQAPAGRADARRQQILDRGLAILLFERDAPAPERMLLADGRQGLANRLEVRRRQQPLSREHFRVRDRGSDVVAHQPIVQNMIVPRRVGEYACVERSSLVPEPRHVHSAPSTALSCSAGLKAVRSATTSVPVPSLVKISASRLSVDL